MFVDYQFGMYRPSAASPLGKGNYILHTLLPWQGGPRLISLRDMKEYVAHYLVDIHKCLVRCSLSETSSELVTDNLEFVRNQARELGLRSTEQGTIRLLGLLEGDLSHDEKHRHIQTIAERFHDDIVSLILFYLPTSKLAYYNKTDLFGEDFKTRFPSANAEIIEAGNCFAFDRFSATVFHLTHALEIALRVLFLSLGMPAQIWSVTKWQKILRRIDGKIKRNNERLSNDADWQRDRPFYEKAHAFLAAAANPLRNSSVHVDVVYSDESSVRPVWLGTEAFMRHIATKLKESP